MSRTTAADPVKIRITALMIGCVALGAAVITRATFVQIIGDERLDRMAKRQFRSTVLIRPARGTITDRNGEALAVNVEVQSLAANPTKVKNRTTMARLLSKATGVPVSKILPRLNNGKEFVWIKRHLTQVEIDRLQKWNVMESNGSLMPGLWLVKESKRAYPHGETAAHLLGTVNIDAEGMEGTELWMNERMRGEVISVSAVKDALGRPTFMDAVAAKDVKDGENVALTIDASLQFSVEQALKESVKKHSARSGTVIVMNASNGEVLAMANEPSFNPNEKSAAAATRRNRALTDGYEPGSTLKSVLLAGALSNGFKLTDQLWGERGQFTVQGKKISEAEAHEKFEWTSLKRMIQVSSNVVAAKLALKLGTEKYHSTLQSFGFAKKSGSGFPGEISGKVLAKNKWTPLALANIGFGHGVLVTPIQMLRAYAAFANGGYLVQPRLIKDPDDGVPLQAPTRVLTEKVAAQMTEALESVTDKEGTGIKATLDGYRVAGKTGTAQVVDPNTGRYSRSRYIASFIGYPVGIEPKLVIFTAIDEPKGVYYASETAAPLFQSVLQATVNRFSLPQVVERTLANAPNGASKDKIKTSSAKSVPAQLMRKEAIAEVLPRPNALEWQATDASGATHWKMPSLKGLTVREALQILEGHRFSLKLQGVGIIKGQSPDEGKAIAEGAVVRLTLAE